VHHPIHISRILRSALRSNTHLIGTICLCKMEIGFVEQSTGVVMEESRNWTVIKFENRTPKEEHERKDSTL
jgi:hypothetical protein